MLVIEATGFDGVEKGETESHLRDLNPRPVLYESTALTN